MRVNFREQQNYLESATNATPEVSRKSRALHGDLDKLDLTSALEYSASDRRWHYCCSRFV